MTFELGTEYKIAHVMPGVFNSADTLTIVRQSGDIVQFTLGNGKGRGAMPVDHLKYLLNKNELTVNKRSLLNHDDTNEKIG
ncbi:hypothetical protein [Halalkalibacter krulwichiae]|uniref:Uncharacterized protein n=1 Tax=Halalkalibacter krulwichiae TaxID=199441 RepID=A0A1X9MDI4_9BACI|nr:hypothetical protein [Halalkalibacter krulwichiae]ARK30610.1 hypothetical protein BkAM31D_12650 [Halalkalibacter krulwichiae]